MKNVDLLLQNGVAVNEALELWGGDLQVYNDNLKDYQTSLQEKKEELAKYLEAGDWNNYGILAHSLKSESKYFGFMKEADVFLQHEQAGKNSDQAFIQTNFAALKEMIEGILNLLSLYFGEEDTALKNILAVDDSAIVLNFIENLIGSGYTIIKATNGNEALNKLATEQIYAIFLDLNMPGSNGFEVLNYLQEQHLIEKIPVVIITGDDTEETIQKAFTYPILDVLNKPFTEENINRILNSIENFYHGSN